MDQPNLIESLRPLSGQYSCRKDLRLNLWLAVATATYLAGLLLAKKFPEWSPWAHALIALAPIVPGAFYILTWKRFIGGMDELQKRVQLEAFLFAALGTLLIGSVVNTLNASGIPVTGLPHGLGLGGLFLAMFPLWLVGGAVANRQYK